MCEAVMPVSFRDGETVCTGACCTDVGAIGTVPASETDASPMTVDECTVADRVLRLLSEEEWMVCREALGVDAVNVCGLRVSKADDATIGAGDGTACDTALIVLL